MNDDVKINFYNDNGESDTTSVDKSAIDDNERNTNAYKLVIDVKINIDNNDNDKEFIIKKPDSDPHNGKLCTMMEISPSCKYVVTYSREDHSFVGWNIDENSENTENSESSENTKNSENTDEGRLKPEIFIIITNKDK